MTVNACFDFCPGPPERHTIPCSARIKNTAPEAQLSCPLLAVSDLTSRCLKCLRQSLGLLSCAVRPLGFGKASCCSMQGGWDVCSAAGVTGCPWRGGLRWHQQGLYLTPFQGNHTNMALPLGSSQSKMAGLLAPASTSDLAGNRKQTLTRNMELHRMSSLP